MIRRSSTCGCLAFLLWGLVGCSGDDAEPRSDAGSEVPDAGQESPDSGSESDSGAEMPDAGNDPTACNPVDGTGCADPNQFCVLQRGTEEGMCRELINPVGHQQSCSLLQQNCEVGLACSFFDGDDDPICRQVCRLDSNQDCQALGADYDCIVIPAANTVYGYCGSTAAACDPLMPDTCPDPNETCGVQLNALACIEVGTTALGENCQQQNCVSGAVCIPIGNINNSEPVCYEPCDSNTSCTLPAHDCRPLSNLDLSLCIPPN